MKFIPIFPLVSYLVNYMVTDKMVDRIGSGSTASKRAVPSFFYDTES